MVGGGDSSLYIGISVWRRVLSTHRRCATFDRCEVPLGSQTYILNTRNEENNTVFYSDSAYFVNTFTLNMYVSMSHTVLIRRDTLFIFLWLRHKNT